MDNKIIFKLVFAAVAFIIGVTLEGCGIKYTNRKFWAIIGIYALIALSIINKL